MTLTEIPMRGMAAVASIVVVVVGCASSGAPVSNSTPPAYVSVSQTQGRMQVNYSLSPELRVSPAREIPATVTTAWNTLPAVYKQLGLTITAYDTTSHLIVGERLRSRRDFASRPLRDLMDCGDVAGIPNIEHYEINIRVRTLVEKAGPMSEVVSQVDATARAGTVAGPPVRCSVNDGIADGVASTLAATVQQP